MDTAILHLAPVARETPRACFDAHPPRADFVGLTPQGLLREWDARGDLTLAPPPQELLPERCDAVVLSAGERGHCEEFLATAREGGAIVAVTAGAQPVTLLLPDGGLLSVPVPAIAHPRMTWARATCSLRPSSSPCARAAPPRPPRPSPTPPRRCASLGPGRARSATAARSRRGWARERQAPATPNLSV